MTTGMLNQFWRKSYIDAYGNLPNGMRLPVRIRTRLEQLLAAAMPRDLRIAIEEGDLLQEFPSCSHEAGLVVLSKCFLCLGTD